MQKIPKMIHYCWLSDNEYPELIQKCMNSWKTILPEYEFICWDTKRFDVNICDFTREAFEQKKYAFVSDYIRLYALYHYGGIYLDTDIEVLKNFEPLLEQEAFTCFENNYSVAAWIFGSKKENPLFKEFLDYYSERHFILTDGKFDMTPNPIPITAILKRNGLELDGQTQSLTDITVYTQDYFCPYDHISENLNITDNTYTIHYFNGFWFTDAQRKRLENRKKIQKKYGKNAGYIYQGISVLREDGVKSLLKEIGHLWKKY